jgi:uncharacterized protein YdhG (YjbR/CyaY superfamily)
MAKAATVDEYIGSCPDDVQQVLREIRRRLHAAMPETGETISYDMPTITLTGKRLIHFAAWKKHISVYPVPSGDATLEQELAPCGVHTPPRSMFTSGSDNVAVAC